MADGVRRVAIDEDGVVGTVFLPPERLDDEYIGRPRPLIVNATGGIHKGALVEEKAAILASRGSISSQEIASISMQLEFMV